MDTFESTASKFESFIRQNWKPGQAEQAEEYLQHVIHNLERLIIGSVVGSFCRYLKQNLTPAEYASLPSLSRQVLQGRSIHFRSYDERKQKLEVEQQERHRREATRRREAEEQERLRQQRRQREFEDAAARLAEVRTLRGKLDALRGASNGHIRSLECTIEKRVHDDFLEFDKHVSENWSSLPRITRFYRRERANFVSRWAERSHGLSLDNEQGAAVGAVTGNVLVTARAGSGKTRVLTARALFLHKHCGVPVHRIMLLAFNRRAASEMGRRLRAWLGDDIPHVMTFHALAYALVHPSEKLGPSHFCGMRVG